MREVDPFGGCIFVKREIISKWFDTLLMLPITLILKFSIWNTVLNGQDNISMIPNSLLF